MLAWGIIGERVAMRESHMDPMFEPSDEDIAAIQAGMELVEW